MKNELRRRGRFVARVLAALESPSAAEPAYRPLLINDLGQLSARLQRTSNHLNLCLRRNWRGAANRMEAQIAALARQARDVVDGMTRSRQPAVITRPSYAELWHELVAAEAEFGAVDYCGNQHSLFITTDPIALEGVELGRFVVHLILPALASGPIHQAVRVVALEPNPAATQPAVTHPHVSDERLCAGDATAALVAALRSGRLADAWQLILGVLSNYNADSPYVALDDWRGTPCSDCALSVAPEDAYTCTHCEDPLCEECTRSCIGCEDSFCYSCLGSCPQCDEPICKSCRRRCEACDAPTCPNCAEEGLCPDCQSQEDECDETTTPSPQAGLEPARAPH